jgi:HK97 family phage portal protein
LFVILQTINKARNWLSEKVAVTPKINFTSSYGNTRTGLMDTQGDVLAMYNAFKGIVFSCINARAKEVARTCSNNTFIPYIQKGVDELIPLDNNHPLQELLRKPNPYISPYEFWHCIQTSKDLTGNAYSWIGRDKLGVPRELWLIPSTQVSIVTGDIKKGEPPIISYIIQNGAERVEINSEDILHFKLMDPKQPYGYGMSLVMKAATEIDIDFFISEHQRNFFKNDAIPPAVITFKNNLNADARKAFEENWIRKYKMKPGKIGYLEGDASIQMLLSSKELDYLASIPAIRQKIQSVFGVPDSKLMLSETITARATLETIDYNFLKETIAPEITQYAGQLTNDLAEFFASDIVIVAEEIIPKDRAQLLDEDTKRLANGTLSINEIRLRDGYEALRGGEEPLVSYGVMPLSNVLVDVNEKSFVKKEFKDSETDSEIDSETEKLKAWKNHSKFQMKNEMILAKGMNEWLKSVERDVLDNLNKVKGIAVTEEEVGQWLKRLNKMLTPEAQRILKEAFQKFVNENEIDGLVFSPNSPRVRETVQKIVSASENIPLKIKEKINKTLQEGVKMNETPSELAGRIEKYFSKTNSAQAIRVARTVSNSAVNEGNNVAAQESGIFKRKMWLTQRDGRVRDSHWEMDGVKVLVSEKFSLKNPNSNLNVPGDPLGNVEQIVNCRCTAVYLRK